MELICSKCGSAEDVYETSDGKILCASCLEDDYLFCEICDEWHPADEVHEIKRNWRGSRMSYICEDCLESDSEFYYCEECENWFSELYSERVITHRGSNICWSCYDRYYRTCEDCGEVFFEDDGAWDDGDNCWYCNNCNSRRTYIKNYGYKPKPKFKTKTDYFHTDQNIKELLLGVENEIDQGENPLDTAANLCKTHEDIYIKHDGSLSSRGMEIVTHPCTLEYHTEKLGWDSICKIALESKYRSHDARTCGLHVHVGRNQLGSNDTERMDTVAKIVLLVDRHWAPIVRFSRRSARQLRDWASPPNFTFESGRVTESELKDKALGVRYNGRYQAVNLTNYATIEFRVFNGTLRYETIIATLQLVSNICEFAKSKTFREVMRSTWNEVANYKPYGELQAYLKMKGLDCVDDPEPINIAVGITYKDADCEYKVGDLVEVMNSDGDHVYQLRHAIGRLARVIEVNCGPELPVRLGFDSSFTGAYGWRSPENVYHDHTYMVYPYNIAHVLDF